MPIEIVDKRPRWRPKDEMVYLSYAFVCFGPAKDFFDIRKYIEENYRETRLIYNTCSSTKLFIRKEGEIVGEKEKGSRTTKET